MKIPIIEYNAFYENKAKNIISPKFGPINDHCFIKLEDKWHFLTSKHHTIGNSSILDPMKLIQPFSKIASLLKTNEYWAPCAVIKNKIAYIFFASPLVPLKSGWQKFTAYISNGGLFKMVLAQAPENDISKLHITHELFEEDGGARDPFVFWHETSKQWVIIYDKRIYENKSAIESGIVYRISQDLIHWSEQKGYIIRKLFYDSEIKDNVTVTIGNGESPQLIFYDSHYYLFVTHVGYGNYHRTKVWVSDSPFHFEDPDKPIITLYVHAPEILYEDSKWYISNCGQHQKEFGEAGKGLRIPGIEIARLLWK